MTTTSGSAWRFVHFGVIVTGKGERQCLSGLLDQMCITCHGAFKVIGSVDQKRPGKQLAPQLRVVGTAKKIPDKFTEKIGLRTRSFLDEQRKRGGEGCVLLIDDLEHASHGQAAEVTAHYREIADPVLRDSDQKRRFSVHLFHYMLENYFFANGKAIEAVLGVEPAQHEGDAEMIRHAKGRLKEHAPHYKETKHGPEIVEKLRLSHILRDPHSCAHLRSLVWWCTAAMGDIPGDHFALRDGMKTVSILQRCPVMQAEGC